MHTASLRSAVGSLVLIFGAGLPPAKAPQAVAQSQHSGLFLVAAIPFPFQVGSQQMPPDTYTFRRYTEHFVIIQGERSHVYGQLAVIGGADPKPIDHSSLIFRRHGDQYFLGRINAVASQLRLECSPGGAEKRAVQAQELLTRQRPTPPSIEVALTQ